MLKEVYDDYNFTKHLYIIAVVFLSSCGGSTSNTVNFDEYGDFFVECGSPEGGPSECDGSHSGKTARLTWGTGSCADLSLDQAKVYVDRTLSCILDVCSADDRSNWYSVETDELLTKTSKSNTTARAWLNISDNGSLDLEGPASGDVVCCSENSRLITDMLSDACVTVQ